MKYPHSYGEAEHVRALDALLADIRAYESADQPTLKLHAAASEKTSEAEDAPSQPDTDALLENDDALLDPDEPYDAWMHDTLAALCGGAETDSCDVREQYTHSEPVLTLCCAE